MARRILAVGLVLLVVLAGCQSVSFSGDTTTDVETTQQANQPTTTATNGSTDESEFDFADPE